MNGQPLGKEDIDGMMETFGDPENEKMIPLEGFQNMFAAQAQASVEETFKDLRKMGFDENLDPLPADSTTSGAAAAAAAGSAPAEK
jgi:hypothetical protein